jgi:hypothetical protein
LLPATDVAQLLPLIVGHPRRRADRLLADRGYDFDKYRRELRQWGVFTEECPP